MKGKKEKFLGNFVNAGEVEIPNLSPLKHSVKLKVNSFILKHVWDQEYKDHRERVLMDQYWKWHEDDTTLANFMLDIGKYRGRKDNKKLLSTVNRV